MFPWSILRVHTWRHYRHFKSFIYRGERLKIIFSQKWSYLNMHDPKSIISYLKCINIRDFICKALCLFSHESWYGMFLRRKCVKFTHAKRMKRFYFYRTNPYLCSLYSERDDVKVVGFCFVNSDASNQKKSWRLKMIIDIRKMSQPLSFIRTGNLPPTTN